MVADTIEETKITALKESSQLAACERSAATKGLCCTALGAKAEIWLFLNSVDLILEGKAEIPNCLLLLL